MYHIFSIHYIITWSVICSEAWRLALESSLPSLFGGASVTVVIRDPHNLADIDIANLPADVRAALQVGSSELRIKTKSYVWWSNDPWAAFVAAAGVVFVLTLVGIIVLLNSYRK